MALILSRRVGERIIVDGGRLIIEVAAITSGSRVKLALSASSDVSIWREELMPEPDEKVSEPRHRLVNAMTNCV